MPETQLSEITITNPIDLDQQRFENYTIPKLKAKYSVNHPNHFPFDSKNGEAITAVARLSFKLKDKLTSYNTVLIDDTSGRSVGFYLLEQIKTKKKEIGSPTRTVAYGLLGGSEDIYPKQNEAVKDFIVKTNKKNKFGKTLLITEHISTGNGLINIIESLIQEGIDFDIASVSLNPSFFSLKGGTINSDQFRRWLGNKIIYGNKDESGLYFHDREENGVIKLKYLKNTNNVLPHAQKDKSVEQSKINQARNNIRCLAHEILEAIE
jgi:hypothetical protein